MDPTKVRPSSEALLRRVLKDKPLYRISNAVDACNYRKLAGDTFAPAISIEFNSDVSTIKVRDNGIGMNREAR